MAQIQGNGAASAAVVEARSKREAFASIITQEEAAAIKAKIIEDGGREFAALMMRESMDRPRIEIDDKGRLVPKDFDSLFRVARWIASLALYGTKEKGGGFRFYTDGECAAIIAAGRRLGMDPLYAMETIALINNKTYVFGRGVRGVILASGLLEDWQETRTGFDDNGMPGDDARVVVTLKRKGMPTPIVGSFSVQQAKAAGLWGGSDYSPWKKYPGDMLTWRAIGRASLGFSDVLGGMSIVEEQEDVAEPPAAILKRDLESMPAPTQPHEPIATPGPYRAAAADPANDKCEDGSAAIEAEQDEKRPADLSAAFAKAKKGRRPAADAPDLLPHN